MAFNAGIFAAMRSSATEGRIADTRGPQKAYTTIRTNSSDPAFRALVAELDKDLAIRDGNDHAFFAQFNKIDNIRHAVLVMDGTNAVGCGAMKAFDADAMEIKRMYTAPTHRKQGIGSLVLRELESWAHELGIKRCVLETGQKQPEAIALYTKCGYRVIPNYGQYAGVLSSVCFEKRL
jgi:putative acetyltransferase